MELPASSFCLRILSHYVGKNTFVPPLDRSSQLPPEPSPIPLAQRTQSLEAGWQPLFRSSSQLPFHWSQGLYHQSEPALSP